MMKTITNLSLLAVSALMSFQALADKPSSNNSCGGLTGNPKQQNQQLKQALNDAIAQDASGFNLNMWATVVNRDGIVCAVAFTGADRDDQWPLSRVISAQKANTSNGLSLDAFAISTATLYSAVQPGGSLYGLQHSNPVDTENAYRGPSSNYGSHNDPLVGKKIGGVNVFGGGLGLYSNNLVVGGVGVSGDTSCRDHMVAWHLRHNLGLDQMTGVGGFNKAFGTDPDKDTHQDNIIYDIGASGSTSGFGHPTCHNTSDPTTLPDTQ